MDIHQLKLFTSLSRNLHFGKTGFEMHLSPSAVSRNIQRLEDSLGHTLFNRDNRSVSLTEQGEIFHRYAMDVLNRFDALQIELGQTSEALSGTLTLFASVTASQSILPTVLSRFRKDYPGIHIQLETGYAVNALRRLFEGCDVVVAALPDDDDEQLHKRIITSIPIVTVAPESAPDIEHLLEGEVDWSTVPIILPSAGQARDSIDEWLKLQNIRPNIYAEVAGNEAILSLVALGCGVGFVPELVMNDSPLADRVRVIISGPILSDFHVGFCSRKNSLASSPVIQAFWASI